MTKLTIFVLSAIALITGKINFLSNRHYMYVASLSPPQTHQKISVWTTDYQSSLDTKSSRLSYEFEVMDRCTVRSIIAGNNEVTSHTVGQEESNQKNVLKYNLSMVETLLKWNPNGSFPSKSQVRRSLEFGKILLFNTTTGVDVTNIKTGFEEKIPRHDDPEDRRKSISVRLEDLQSYIGNEKSRLELDFVLVLVQPVSSPDRYPASVTKYMFPPHETIGTVPIVYEDDYLAVLNKPENMTTIGGKSGSTGTGRSNDLQSVLGFLLRPSPIDPTYYPRPVHRLDRRTSGLILVAKTQNSMRTLSRAFADRVVTKVYSALVFERNHDLSARLGGVSSSDSAKAWLVVDYPIEKQEAVSEIRRVTEPILSSSSSLQGKEKLDRNDDDEENSSIAFSLVEIRPKTGRTHQIRRHLSYCLGMPIVGDSKYDGGARHLRINGMYLCCHHLRFPHPNQNISRENVENPPKRLPYAIVKWIDNKNGNKNDPFRKSSSNIGKGLSIRIPLPNKYRQWTN